MSGQKCELCGDVGSLTLSGQCHPTAPLRLVLDGSTLEARCYVPECDRLVARFRVVAINEPEPHNR